MSENKPHVIDSHEHVETCYHCMGTMRDPANPWADCPACDGMGDVNIRYVLYSDGSEEEYVVGATP